VLLAAYKRDAGPKMFQWIANQVTRRQAIATNENFIFVMVRK
jgi:hypothetical protein